MNEDSVASAATQNGGRGCCVGRGSEVVAGSGGTDLERDVLLTEQSIDDRDALVEALAALVEAHPEPLELVRQEGARRPRVDRPRSRRACRSHRELRGWLKTGSTAPVMSRIVLVRAAAAARKMSGLASTRRSSGSSARRADVREPEGLGLLGESQCLVEVLARRRRLGPDGWKNCTPNSIEPPSVGTNGNDSRKRSRVLNIVKTPQTTWPI
jgi:hypothetical protein